MIFNSFAYFIFLPVVFVLYWTVPHKFRWVLLLASSYYFYMSWNPKYAVLILTITICSYFCAIVIEKYKNPAIKRMAVAVMLAVCFGILFIFKYFNFALRTLSHFIPFQPPVLDILLPVGISFYTFQTIGYVIDVYRGQVRAEKHIGIYAAFVAFFPQLVAGPIERSSNLLPQIKKEHSFIYTDACYGIWHILWGMYKKTVIADNLAVMADMIYGDVYSYKGFSLFLATLLFTVQIYCDFSGYSDIAKGSAEMFGIKLMDNFKSPYFSSSVREFWSRWHISLSGWFRDYLYIPLGGNRMPAFRSSMNVLAVFLVSGLWHGADWSFVAWGGVHGIAQVYENAFGIKKSNKQDFFWFIRVVCVFTFTMMAWTFFRAQNIYDAFYVLRYMFSGIMHPLAYIRMGLADISIDMAAVSKMIFLYLLPLCMADYISLKSDILRQIEKCRMSVRHVLLITGILLVLIYGYAGQSSFVYFQF